MSGLAWAARGPLLYPGLCSHPESLERTIRHAESDDLVLRNVAALVKVPQGRSGRPSKWIAPASLEAKLAGYG